MIQRRQVSHPVISSMSWRSNFLRIANLIQERTLISTYFFWFFIMRLHRFSAFFQHSFSCRYHETNKCRDDKWLLTRVQFPLFSLFEFYFLFSEFVRSKSLLYNKWKVSYLFNCITWLCWIGFFCIKSQKLLLKNTTNPWNPLKKYYNAKLKFWITVCITFHCDTKHLKNEPELGHVLCKYFIFTFDVYVSAYHWLPNA